MLSGFLLAGMSGCASNSPLEQSDLKATDGQHNVKSLKKQDKVFVFQESAKYIPKREINPETGQLIPYQKSINPYSVLKDQIAGADVVTYINARRAMQRGDNIKAVELLEQLIKQSSQLSGPWVMLGDIADKNSKNEEAIRHYSKAIEINESNVNAYIRLAKVQREQGRFIEAQNTYVQVLSLWPDFPEAHLNLAILYDLYMNKLLQSQRHMEAYQFLTGGRDTTRASWLAEIQQRTGKAVSLKLEKKKKASTLNQGAK